MGIAHLTSKGQITIPKDIRVALGLRTGDGVDFQLTSKANVRLSPVSRKVNEVFGMLARRRGKRVSGDKLDAALTQAFRKGRV
jgi:AbrB family looped-hinge helix DNA binding protein